jgi:hypothetical protein
MFVPGKSPVKVQCIVYIVYIVYMDQGTRFSLCGESGVDQLGSISLYSPFVNQFWIVARLVCSFFEAVSGSLSVANITILSAEVAVVDSGEGELCVLSFSFCAEMSAVQIGFLDNEIIQRERHSSLVWES